MLLGGYCSKYSGVTILVTIIIFAPLMRIIAVQTLRQFWREFPKAKQSLLAWYEEAETATWNNPNQLKAQYRNASVVDHKRVVFNICGNDYRLVVDIEYRLLIVFIVWFGTHKQYDKIDVKTISYANASSYCFLFFIGFLWIWSFFKVLATIKKKYKEDTTEIIDP